MLVLRRRRVRIHQAGNAPTVEGILIGSLDNHYRLIRPTIWEASDRSHSVDGEIWVPRENVLFVETIRS